jgi:ribosomal protein S14
MKYLLLKDKRKRFLYSAFEKRIKYIKALIQNLKLPKKARAYLYMELFKMPRDLSITRIRNRCFLTNRPRAVYKSFGLSRLMFRKYAWLGKLVGVKKASW